MSCKGHQKAKSAMAPPVKVFDLEVYYLKTKMTSLNSIFKHHLRAILYESSFRKEGDKTISVYNRNVQVSFVQTTCHQSCVVSCTN